MTFTVTYRSATGALCEVCVEAASRTDCLSQMKARGLAPVRVRERAARNGRRLAPNPGMAGDESAVAHGRSRREGEGGSGAKSPSVPSKALLAAVCALALAVGGGVWWWLHSGRAVEAPERPPEVPRQETRSVAESTAAVQVVSTPFKLSTNASVQLPIGEKTVVPQPDAGTNNIIRAGSGMKGRRMTLMDGTEVVHDAKPIFKHPFERMLHSAMRPGGFPLNLAILRARYSDSDIAMALATEEKIAPDDPENVVEAKRRMNAAKAEIREFLKSGGTLEEAVEQIREHNQSVNNERVASMTILRELVQEGNGEAVREFVKERNAKHRELGLPELKVPPQFDMESKENKQ